MDVFQKSLDRLNPLVQKVIPLIKKYLGSQYAVLTIISIIVFGMTGYILLLPADIKKQTPPVATRAQTMQIPGNTPSPISPTPDIVTTLAGSQSASPPAPTVVPTPTTDPTASWPVYTNSAHGYTVKYPADWVIQSISPLEPRVPSYIVFNPRTASASSRSITISVSNRTFDEQLAIGGQGSPVIAAGISSRLQYLQDSNGNQSATIVLPRQNDLVLLHAKLVYASVFNAMITTFRLVN